VKLKKIYLFSCSLILFLLLGELVAYMFIRVPEPPAIRDVDPYGANPFIKYRRPYIFFHIPHSQYFQQRAGFRVKYEMNSRGFRGPEPENIHEITTRNIIVLGDSIVEGHGVEFHQTFCSILDNDLHTRNWQVINCGVQGSSPIYFACNMARYLSLKPALVVIVLFPNDLYEDNVRERLYFKIPYMNHEERLCGNRKSNLSFQASSLFNLLRTIVSRIKPLSVLEQMIRENKNIIEGNIGLRDMSVPCSALLAKRRWKLSEKYLDYVCSGFRQHHVPVLIAYLDILQEDLHDHHVYSEAFQECIQRWTADKSIPFLSLYTQVKPLFSAYSTNALIIRDDGHPTALAHEKIAEMLKKAIEEQINP